MSGGRKPISGGFKAGNASEPGLFLNSAEGIDGRKWSVSTLNIENDPAPFTSFAYCSRTARAIRIRRSHAKIGPGSQRSVTATCHRRERVVSGGYALVEQSPLDGGILDSSRADSRSWTVHGANGGEPGDGSVTLFVSANCLPKSKIGRVIAKRATTELVANAQTTSTTKCGTKQYAISGGYRFDQDDGFPLFTGSSRDGDNAWRHDVRGFGSGTLTLIVYCVRKK